MANLLSPRHRRDFKIAVICALPLEADAVEALFDKHWDEDGHRYGKGPEDQNAYRSGVISRHNVVLAFMPGIKFALVVGICGGVPKVCDNEEILLGDVVISDGIIEYDFGRRLPDKFAGSAYDKTSHYLTVLREKLGNEKAGYLGAAKDKLFEPAYRHKHHDLPSCIICANSKRREDQVCDDAQSSSCQKLECDEKMLVPCRRLIEAREVTGSGEEAEVQKPVIHFGLIASGDTIMKSGEDRDEIASKEGIIAFEMEGAGSWDNLPCVVIKGVCDYADSHKNKGWQNYTASTAAACMKAFLEECTITDEMSLLPLYNNVPQRAVTYFVVRTKIQKELDIWLQEQRPSQRFVLHGMGGSGKTQLAFWCCSKANNIYRL